VTMDKDQATRLLAKIAGYLEILGKDPRSTVFVPLSDAYRRLGMLDDALSLAQRGVQTLPWFGPGFVALGRVQMQQGDVEEALHSFRKALELDEDSIAAMQSLVRLHLLRGEKDQAVALLERAVQLAPEQLVFSNLLRSLRTAGAEAAACSEDSGAAAEPAAAPIATTTLADLYVRQGHFQRALDIYQQLLSVHPDDPRLRAACDELQDRLSGVAEEQPDQQAASLEVFEPAIVYSDTPTAEGTEGTAATALGAWLTAIRKRREHVR
jgi:tetratricopeptide (TPR) repeat protein